jgi:hypothetical protein
MGRMRLTVPLALFAILALPSVAHSLEDMHRGEPPGKTADFPAARIAPLTQAQVLDARRHFHVEVLSYDTSKRYCMKLPYSDYVKLKITNHSGVTLPYITPLTKRYSNGNAIGWSRSPEIAVHDVPPGQSKTIDYYPLGHLSVVPVDKLTVEIEPTIDEWEMRLFKELAR